MDVLPDEQETLIQETAREFFAAESTPALVRAAEKDPGQYSAALWKKIADLGWLGISLDADANAADAPVISAPGSHVTVLVEPTNEEWVAARHCLDVLGPAPLSRPVPTGDG